MAFIAPAVSAVGSFLGANAPAISTFATAAGTGLSAYGAYAQGKAQQEAADYNSKIAQQQADIAREDAREAAGRRREDHRRQLARLRAQYGAAGLAEVGAPADIYAETASRLELELADIYAAADRRAGALENSASLYAFEGNRAGRAGTMGMASALTSGLGRLGEQAFTFRERGIGSTSREAGTNRALIEPLQPRY